MIIIIIFKITKDGSQEASILVSFPPLNKLVIFGQLSFFIWPFKLGIIISTLFSSLRFNDNQIKHIHKSVAKLKKWERIWIEIFPKKIYKWQQVQEKVLHITSYQRNANQKAQRGITLHLLEWLLSNG